MDTVNSNLESVAQAVGCRIAPAVEVQEVLRRTSLIFDGFGSIARPASEKAARRGARCFVLADPKAYRVESIASQCSETEVGRRKVDVGLEVLRELGANTVSFARDIGSVPEGVIGPESIVITTVDNRRADIVSNRRAARMGARLIKINVEPALGVAAVRAYDFRGTAPLCVECQFSNHHYAAQRHPRSCDGGTLPTGERQTKSPRWLSNAAANLAVLALLDLAADDADAGAWVGHERQYFPESGNSVSSRLETNPNCRWNHAERWSNVVRLNENENTISLRELFWAASIDVDSRANVRLCQQVALRCRCTKCRTDFAVVRWITDSQAPVGTCENCGSPLLPIPFSVFSEVSTEPLFGVMDKRLGDWGVERAAVVEVSREGRRVSFVIGGYSNTRRDE